MMEDEIGDSHPSEETLELYSLGRLTGSNREAVDEHLLLCLACQDYLTANEQYFLAMKAECTRRAAARPAFARWFPLPTFDLKPVKPLMVALAACVLIVIAIPYYNTGNLSGPEIEIALVASRGVAGSVAAASTGSPLKLSVDLAQLPPYDLYKVAIVSPAGSTVSQYDLKPEAGRLTLHYAKRLAAGTYWVRVSSPGNEPIREFGLEIR